MELLEPRTRACKRNMPAIIDYQFRAVHQVTVATKQYVEANYSQPIDRDYFDGCSKCRAQNRRMDGVIKDPNLAPNHSFRHYLKSELLARDVPERISDAITGHKTPDIGRKYEHVPMSKKFDAISKLPVVSLLQPAISDLGTNPIASNVKMPRALRCDEMRVTQRAH